MKTILKRVNISIFIVLASFMLAGPLPADAQEKNEYFEYTITGKLDKQSVLINEQFTAILSSQGICKVDMPISIPAVMISIRIYARNKNQNSEITLTPDYSFTMKDIPTVKGKTFNVENEVPLMFPVDSLSGQYDVFVDITSVKFQIFEFWADGLEYMPANPIPIDSIEVYQESTSQLNINPNPTTSSTSAPTLENELSIPPSSIELADQTTNNIDQDSQGSDDNSRQFIYGLIIGAVVCLIILGSVLFIARIRRKQRRS